jgi:allantoinase
MDADLVLVDPEADFTLKADDLFYRNQHSAYVGTRFQGAIKTTISRGVTVYDNGRIVGAIGHGRRLC